LPESTRRVCLLTGPVRSGKTTRLIRLLSGIREVEGFLTPDQNGLRHLLDLKTMARHPFQVHSGPIDQRLDIGPFSFTLEAFERMHQLLRNALIHRPPLLVVDEIGPLELQGQGVEPVFSEVWRALEQARWPGTLLVVVRESLVSRFLEHYRCPLATILKLADLDKFCNQFSN
jgi:nucleoside-triphosphatase THEP1